MEPSKLAPTVMLLNCFPEVAKYDSHIHVQYYNFDCLKPYYYI
jgi:hypothetical protein